MTIEGYESEDHGMYLYGEEGRTKASAVCELYISEMKGLQEANEFKNIENYKYANSMIGKNGR